MRPIRQGSPQLLAGWPPYDGLEMGGIDHDPVRSVGLACQLGEDAIEHAQSAPVDKAVADRLVQPVKPLGTSRHIRPCLMT